MPRTVVFLHAASYTRAMWLPQTWALRGEFRTLALDLPAHGALAHEPFTLRAATDTVLRALDETQTERAILVGASLGGCVSMLFAAQHPERVAGLVLAGCSFNPCRPLAQAVLTAEGIVFVRGARRFTRTFHAWAQANFPLDMACEIVDGGAHWHGAAQAVRALRGVDFRARLAAYHGPTLIVNGTRDWVHRSSESSFARVARQAEVVLIPDAGHLPSLDAPDLFTDAVRTFARRTFCADAFAPDGRQRAGNAYLGQGSISGANNPRQRRIPGV